MGTPEVTPSFRTIRIIYGAYMISALIFLVVIYTILQIPTFGMDTSNYFTYLVPLTALIGFYLSGYLYRSSLIKTNSAKDLKEKLAHYTTANLVRGACLEAPALLAIVATLLTENVVFLVIALLLLFVMLLKFPTKDRFSNDVKLNLTEKSEFNRL